jgi:DNA-binding response OmpR family regulator
MENKIKTWLIAEDDDNDFFLLHRALVRDGFDRDIQRARDGVEAIAYLNGEKFGPKNGAHLLPELLVLDLKMPRANGFDVLGWIQHRGNINGMPVVMFTSSDDPGDVARAYALGAKSYLVKPSGPSSYLEAAQMLKKICYDSFELAEHTRSALLVPRPGK